MKLTLEQQCDRRAKVNRIASMRCGAPVKSMEHLDALAYAKRSVYCCNCWGLLPAVAVMNMRAKSVLDAIKSGWVFEYSAKARGKEESAT